MKRRQGGGLSPRMAPIGPRKPPECPTCGECPPPTTTKVARRDPTGTVKGDIKCAECGETLRKGVLLRKPDRI